jgi:hypothetical protein
MNPYKVLGIGQCTTKREILQATALALRERKYSGREIAEAQKELMDPVSKVVHDFIHFIDVKPLLERVVLVYPERTITSELHYLNPFDNNP